MMRMKRIPRFCLALGTRNAKRIPIYGGGVVDCINTSATFARPADTTAYAANDAVANSTSAPTILTFTNCARKIGLGGLITKATLATDQAACVAAFRLHLFTTVVSAINDNAAWTQLWANRASYVGYIDFPPLSTEGGSNTAAFAQMTSAPLTFNADTSDMSLYGMLETRTVFTPANAQNFFVSISVERY